MSMVKTMVKDDVPCLLTERWPCQTDLSYLIEAEIRICCFCWLFSVKVHSRVNTFWDLEFVSSPNGCIKKMWWKLVFGRCSAESYKRLLWYLVTVASAYSRFPTGSNSSKMSEPAESQMF